MILRRQWVIFWSRVGVNRATIVVMTSLLDMTMMRRGRWMCPPDKANEENSENDKNDENDENEDDDWR